MHWVFYVCLSPRHKLASISTFAWKLNSEMANPAGKGLLIVKACCKPRSYTHWAESAIEMKHLRQFGTRRLNPGSSSAFNPLINKGLRFRDSAAANSHVPLAFHDEKWAEDVLGELGAERRVVAACLYSSDGKILAEYRRAGIDSDFHIPYSENDGARLRQNLSRFTEPYFLR